MPRWPWDAAASRAPRRQGGRCVQADQLLLGQLDARFYDPATRTYLGAPTPPGPGFFIRPPSAGDPPAAEGLAILAKSLNARAVAAALSASLEESSAQAPGDQLLALRIFESRETRR